MTVAIPAWLFWGFVIFPFLLICIIVYIFIHFWLKNNTDKVLIIDKNNRWFLHSTNLSGKVEEKINKGSYILMEKCGLLNKRGKALYIFAENKPQPLKITYDKTEWLDSESLMGVINNKLVQQIIKPSESLKDTLFLFGAIGGLVAGLASIIILLIQLGVI